MLSSREALNKLSKLTKLARQEHQQAAQQAYQHGHPGAPPVANVEGETYLHSFSKSSHRIRVH